MTFSVKMDIITLKGVRSVTSYEFIKDSFGYDEPILVEDIETLFPERSRPWIDKTIRTMVDERMLKRFSTGVYYIPRQTIFGESVLNPQKVITKKYIKNERETFGYVAGLSLLNSLGLTTQVPNVITVVSNNESSRGREVVVGNQKVYIMKSSAKINSDNCATLKLLETIKLIDLNELDEFEKYNLEKFIQDNNITLKKVSEYCKYFPDYVSKRILGGGLIEKFTQ